MHLYGYETPLSDLQLGYVLQQERRKGFIEGAYVALAFAAFALVFLFLSVFWNILCPPHGCGDLEGALRRNPAWWPVFAVGCFALTAFAWRRLIHRRRQ
jgi:hypothetical protein